MADRKRIKKTNNTNNNLQNNTKETKVGATRTVQTCQMGNQ